MSALRVLVLVAAPRDAMTFDAEKAWSELAAAVKPFEAQGRLIIQRVVPATENALKKSLAAATWDVVHVIANANWRVAAQYGTVILESSTGASRGVSTQYLGEVLQRARLVVLQTAAAGMTWDDGPALLMNTGPVVDPSQATFARSFYASLITGSTIEAAAAHARASLAASGASRSIVVRGKDGDVLSPPPPPPPPVAEQAPAPIVRENSFRLELDRKRAAAEFDVFLCHNSADKPRVRQLADALERRGILPWLDERELPPGQPWQPLLERQIECIRSAAVLVGGAGVGPWQQQELYGFLRAFVDRSSPVIPVLLDDAPDRPELPLFLKAMTWVDFREIRPEPLARLIWGITGVRPAD